MSEKLQQNADILWRKSENGDYDEEHGYFRFGRITD